MDFCRGACVSASGRSSVHHSWRGGSRCLARAEEGRGEGTHQTLLLVPVDLGPWAVRHCWSSSVGSGEKEGRGLSDLGLVTVAVTVTEAMSRDGLGGIGRRCWPTALGRIRHGEGSAWLTVFTLRVQGEECGEGKGVTFSRRRRGGERR